MPNARPHVTVTSFVPLVSSPSQEVHHRPSSLTSDTVVLATNTHTDTCTQTYTHNNRKQFSTTGDREKAELFGLNGLLKGRRAATVAGSKYNKIVALPLIRHQHVITPTSLSLSLSLFSLSHCVSHSLCLFFSLCLFLSLSNTHTHARVISGVHSVTQRSYREPLRGVVMSVGQHPGSCSR